MPRRKEDTPSRIVKRNYEEKHRDERKQKSMLFGTSINREYGEEINAFLQKHGITKVELIAAGYRALQSQYGPNKIE